MALSASSSGGNQPPENKLFPVTIFPDNLARKKRQETLDLAGLETLILATSAPSKDRLPLVKMALFGDVPSVKNCLRHNANMLDITGIEVEHDNGKISFKHAVKTLIAAGLCCLIYTTPSHKPIERERWRVLLPLSRPLPNRERHHLVELVNGLFNGALARESFTLSQAFYFGAVEGAVLHTKRLDGVFVDLAGLTKAIGPAPGAGKGTKSTAPVAAGHTLADLQTLKKEYLRTREGWHNMMLTITSSLVGKQFPDSEIQEFCADVCDLGRDDPEMLDMLASAQAKFGPKAIPAGVAAVAAAAAAAGQAPGRPAIAWDYTEKNTIRLSMLNAARAMLGLGLGFKHDTFHNKMWVESLDDIKADHLGELNDTRVRALRWLVNNTFPVNFEEKPIREAAVTLAERNAFDPVADMLNAAEAGWDGVARIDRMAVDHFNAADTPLNRAFVRKLMIAAVKRVRQPGCKFDQILVMESKEGWNKSSSWRVLAGEGNFSDESIMGRESRMVQEHLADIWILECAELAGITRREIEMVTTFASRQEDRARPAYGHFLISQPRHSILVGTTNAENWLPKQTGNRRFWPLRVLAPIDLKKLKIDRLQLWGEAAALETAGESLVLDQALWEAAAAEQEERRITDPWEDVLVKLKPIAKATLGMVGLFETSIVHQIDGFEFVASADIFEHALKLRGPLDYNSGRRLANVMGQLGWVRSRVMLDGERQRGYRREPKKRYKPRIYPLETTRDDP